MFEKIITLSSSNIYIVSAFYHLILSLAHKSSIVISDFTGFLVYIYRATPIPIISTHLPILSAPIPIFSALIASILILFAPLLLPLRVISYLLLYHFYLLLSIYYLFLSISHSLITLFYQLSPLFYLILCMSNYYSICHYQASLSVLRWTYIS